VEKCKTIILRLNGKIHLSYTERKKVDKRLHGLEQQPSEGRGMGNHVLLRKIPKKTWFTFWIVLKKYHTLKNYYNKY
jgi:hypothetical protein